MNILPKKRWHVRTKDNIARVRKDEAAAKDEEQKRLAKLELAESEVRINFLRSKSGLPARATETSKEPAEPLVSDAASGHFNLFEDYKSHIKQNNKDLEKEKKEEKEKYEKQIGYLTYLGQDTNESLKLRSWYEVAPKRSEVGEIAVIEKDLKNKFTHDPLTLINALLPPEKQQPLAKKIKVEPSTISSLETTSKAKDHIKSSHKSKKSKKEKKHKKDKKHKKYIKDRNKKKKRDHKSQSAKQSEALLVQCKKEMLEKLRKERLRREAREQERQKQLLAPTTCTLATKSTPKEKTETATTPRIVQKYNSQFNPELAKQNMM